MTQESFLKIKVTQTLVDKLQLLYHEFDFKPEGQIHNVYLWV